MKKGWMAQLRRCGGGGDPWSGLWPVVEENQRISSSLVFRVGPDA